MDKDKIIEAMTKALISARGSFVFIYRDVSMNEVLTRSAKEAEMAITALEQCLYESLLKDTKFIVDEKH